MKLTLDEALTVWCTSGGQPPLKLEAAYALLFSYLKRVAAARLRAFRKDAAEDEAVAHDLLIRMMSTKPRTDGQGLDPQIRDHQVRRYLKTAVANKVTDLWRASRGFGEILDVDDATTEPLILEAQTGELSDVGLGAVALEAEGSFDHWLEDHFKARNAARRGVGDNVRRALALLRDHKSGDLDPPPTENALRTAARHREVIMEGVWNVCAGAAVQARFYSARYGGPPRPGTAPTDDTSLAPRLRRLDACMEAARRGEIDPGDTSVECARADVWLLIVRHRYCIYEVSGHALSDVAPGSRTTAKRN